jgi:hypothetical protein
MKTSPPVPERPPTAEIFPRDESVTADRRRRSRRRHPAAADRVGEELTVDRDGAARGERDVPARAARRVDARESAPVWTAIVPVTVTSIVPPVERRRAPGWSTGFAA